MRSAVLATLALLGACSALEHKGAEATLAPQPSLVIVSVDNRDFTSAIQYAVRYAGSLPVVKARAARTKANVGQATSIKSTSPAAEPLTSTHYSLASSLSAWTKATANGMGTPFASFKPPPTTPPSGRGTHTASCTARG